MINSARLLIVEDNLTDANLIELEVLNYSTDIDTKIVSSLDDFKSALKEFKPNLVLSDFDLRAYNAFDVLALLKLEPSHVPCIIITGVINDEETVSRLMLEGAIGFIEKKNLLHIREKLHLILGQLNEAFTTNFQIYEQKLQLLHEIKTLQYEFNKLVLAIPEIDIAGSDFELNLERLAEEIELTNQQLMILKRNI